MNIIITGASKGIGFETAKLLSSRGNTVIAVSRDGEMLIKLKEECIALLPSANIHYIVFDLKNGDYSDLAANIKGKVQKIDVLINNAGAIVNKPFEKITKGDLQQIYGVNVFGVFALIQALLPFMKGSASLGQANAHILNISSMGGFQGSAKFPGLSAYSSSKGALSILTECLAEELKPLAIAVNCLCLGAVQTEMLTQAFPGYKAPLTAIQMADFIADFSVNGHKYFNGKILPVSLSTP